MHERPTHDLQTRPGARAIIRARLALLALALASLLSLPACSGRREQTESANATANAAMNANAQPGRPAQSASPSADSNPPTSNSPASNSPTPAAPQPAEIDDKLARIFKGAVELDRSNKTPALVGDFNGDGSQDIAFAVRPTAPGLSEINSEVSNWILVEPRKVSPPDPHKDTRQLPPPARPKAEPGDVLLAVIHGYGETGWRNTAAQQTYLLRDAVGLGPHVSSRQDASYRFNLRFRGDVIEQELGGDQGVIEWTGSTYAWLAQKSSRQ